MRIAVLADAYPVLSQTFVVNEVAALERLGHDVTVVSGTAVGHEGAATQVAALARLAARAPRLALADVRGRDAWRPQEETRPLRALAPVAERLRSSGFEHVHVHFAAGAAIDGLRLGRLLRVPVSITAHAYEIFTPGFNLARKLRAATFVTTGCRYNVDALRERVPGVAVHEIVMGVDPQEFARRTPHPENRRVLAIGRLVEKKGFSDLVDATALMRDGGVAPESVTIVGDGPLRSALEHRIAVHDLGDVVHLVGEKSPEEIRLLFEDTAVLAMPCVIAANGDRDSMPVVAKEALAMEVPVVATDEVGLPELVDAECGRLVPPRDPDALATGLQALLALTPEQRAVLGRAGRARVMERCHVDTETAKLASLIEAAA